MSHIEIDTPPLRLHPESVRQALLAEGRVGLRRGLLHVESEYKQRAERSRRSGHMIRTITSNATRVGNTVIGYVGAGAFYARYLEEGTGLYGPRNHWITPKSGGVMRWPDRGSGGFTLAGRRRAGAGGRYVYARRVRGIRPRRYLRDAALVAGPKLRREMEVAGVRGAERLLRLAMRTGRVRRGA